MLYRGGIVVWLSLGIALSALAQQQPKGDDLMKIVASKKCPAVLEEPTPHSDQHCDAIFKSCEAAKKDWTKCTGNDIFNKISQCRKEVNDENKKVAAFKAFIIKCRNDRIEKAVKDQKALDELKKNGIHPATESGDTDSDQAD